METPQEAVKLTDKAAEKIKELLSAQENASEQALRVAVRGGGCSGFQYALALDQPKEEDHVFEHQGVAVVVDKVSMQFVFGSEVDYVDGLQGAGFVVNNPNVVAACGCGSSFQVREDAAERRQLTGALRAHRREPEPRVRQPTTVSGGSMPKSSVPVIREARSERPPPMPSSRRSARPLLDCIGGLWSAPSRGAALASGCSTPSISASSPDSNISSTMSQPPTSSPLT